MTEQLKSKRALFNMSQDDVANALNLSSVSYCSKEQGKTDFKRTEIKKLIELFNLTPEETINIFFA